MHPPWTLRLWMSVDVASSADVGLRPVGADVDINNFGLLLHGVLALYLDGL